uniref:Girdin-like n=1 Tax=Caenorhabditis tropicalis TaxID=1561998 RepID=A0A1I7UP22_9PELO
MKSRIEEMMKVFQKEVIDFRSVDEDGFTLDDLKDELNHSGLTKVFPEIWKYAEKVFQEVDEKKKGMVLRTCDLFDALEKCQMLCVIERSHGIKKFIHNQNSCHLFRQLPCDKCRDSAPVSDEDSDKEEHHKDLEDEIVKVLKGLGISKEAEEVQETKAESDSENVSVMMEGNSEDVPEDSGSLEYLQDQGFIENPFLEVEKLEDQGSQGVQKVLEAPEDAEDPKDVRESAESTNLEVLEEARCLTSEILNIPTPEGQIPEDKRPEADKTVLNDSEEAKDPIDPQDPEETPKSPEEAENLRNLEVLDDSEDLENLLESENTKKSVPEVQDPRFGGFNVDNSDTREFEAFQRILSEFNDSKDPEKSEELQKSVGTSSNENAPGNSEIVMDKPPDDLLERNFEDSALLEDSKDPEDIQNPVGASGPSLEAPETKNPEDHLIPSILKPSESSIDQKSLDRQSKSRGIQTEAVGDPEEIQKLKETILKMEEEHREEIERIRKSYETTVTQLERKIRDLEAHGSKDLEKTIRSLKDTNLRLLGQNEEKERMIEMLLNRISNNTPQGF